MYKYLTGSTIRNLRERNGLTQAQLAERLNVSDKAVSKWETGAGLPDITLLEPIARTLRVSVTELLTGFSAENKNMGANILRSKFYVCPVCNNAVHATGEACVSCHGINLPPLQAETPDAEHVLRVRVLDDELHVEVTHPMSNSTISCSWPPAPQTVCSLRDSIRKAPPRRASIRAESRRCFSAATKTASSPQSCATCWASK